MNNINIPNDMLGNIVLPNGKLLLWLALAITVDFVLGVAKSRKQGVQITSHGYRESFEKIYQYMGVVMLVFMCLNMAHLSSDKIPDVVLSWLGDGLLVAMWIAELLSILENLIEIQPEGKITPYLRMAQNVLTMKFLDNIKKFQNEASENNSGDSPA